MKGGKNTHVESDQLEKIIAKQVETISRAGQTGGGCGCNGSNSMNASSMNGGGYSSTSSSDTSDSSNSSSGSTTDSSTTSSGVPTNSFGGSSASEIDYGRNKSTDNSHKENGISIFPFNSDSHLKNSTVSEKDFRFNRRRKL